MLSHPDAKNYLQSIINALRSSRMSPFIQELYKAIAQNPVVQPKVSTYC